MESIYNYSGEDGNKYIIKIVLEEDDMLSIYIKGGEINEIFSSSYILENLNEKFEKIISCKEISDFKKILEKNINKKTLILKPPYKSIINSIWKIFPGDSSKKQTFTLISQKSFNKNISLFFYENFTKSEIFVKESEKQLLIKQKEIIKFVSYTKRTYENNLFIDNMFFLIGKEDNEEKKINNYINIIEEKEKEYEFRSLLIFFDDNNNILDSLMKIINKCYRHQIFVLILTSNDKNKLYNEIANKINKLTESKRSYFDMNNIFIYNNSQLEISKSIISIIKVYTYFNQLGTGFYTKLENLDLKIDDLKEEISNSFHTHYFNILLCGRTGAGKSTFINKFLGEKKSFTLKTKSAGTYKNNFYIHKKYPIKIIDVCGFAGGNETKENLEKMNLIYNKDSVNILIDEPSTDAFSFYGDRRNNIHLLLYFNVYGEKYDILPGETPIMDEAMKLKIPIIFLINKCPDQIFSDEDEMEDLKMDVADARKGTKYEKFKTYCINCLNGKGFDLLLKGIYEMYKNNIIKEDDLDKIKNHSLGEEDFKTIFKNNIFFGDISPKDVFLNESLITSCINIKKLLVKLGGYYSKELKKLKSLKFYFKYKLYNNIWRNSEKNFFPLLTDLVQKIYSNFGLDKTKVECNDFIIKVLSLYFNIDLSEVKSGKKSDDKNIKNKNEEDYDCTVEGNNECAAPYNFSLEKFAADYANLLNLYSDSKNFKITEHIEEHNLKTKGNINEIILNKNNIKEIDLNRLYTLIKRDFGLDNSKRDATSEEKIILKLFYVSYVCNELIGILCGKMNQKSFKYTSIYNFYYTVSLSYNAAINGFLDICKDMIQKEKEIKDYAKFQKIGNSEAPPSVFE
jgi:GTP-binding protein EngB required for normal cell division